MGRDVSKLVGRVAKLIVRVSHLFAIFGKI